MFGGLNGWNGTPRGRLEWDRFSSAYLKGSAFFYFHNLLRAQIYVQDTIAATSQLWHQYVYYSFI